VNRIKNVKTEGWIKLTLTIALSVYSLIIANITNNVGIFIAMFFSTGGDISIMASRDALGTGKDKNKFIKGVVFFAWAHFMYLLSMESIESKAWVVIIGFQLLVVLIICFISYGMDLESDMILNVFYALCIFLATINAWIFSLLAGIGYLLFVTSDIILVIKEEKEPIWQIPIWAFYVAGQICIITSFLMV